MYKTEEEKQQKMYSFAETLQNAEDLEDLLPDLINFLKQNT